MRNGKGFKRRGCIRLGNLTLTGYNAEYSDRPFYEKRDMKGGFRESPLRLNRGLGGLDTWDENAIRDRAGRLAKIAVEIWKGPSLENQRASGLSVRRGGTIESLYH